MFAWLSKTPHRFRPPGRPDTHYPRIVSSGTRRGYTFQGCAVLHTEQAFYWLGVISCNGKQRIIMDSVWSGGVL